MHIVYVLSPGGGPEAFVTTLAPWLEERGHRISVVYAVRPAGRAIPFGPSVRVSFAPPTSGHYFLSKIVGGFRSWPVRLRGYESGWAAYRAALALHAVQPIDVIEVTEGLPISLLQRRWPVVVRAHGSDWTFRLFCQDSDLRHDDLAIASETKQLKNSQGVVAISADLARHLVNACDLRADRILVIPYPVNTEMFFPNGARSGGQSQATVMTVGRLERRKGMDVLLRSMAILWEDFPDVNLLMVGGEAQFTRSDLVAMVPERHRGRIRITGSTPHDALPAFYRQAAVYVAATQYETFGYTILEAMACGIPVVATAVGAIPELIENGVTGMLVPYGDVRNLAAAIKRLLTCEEERVAMGRRARVKAAAYALGRIGKQNEEFYRWAIGRR
jgi:glycosyltransferase involved in cell wall biosynthesis